MPLTSCSNNNGTTAAVGTASAFITTVLAATIATATVPAAPTTTTTTATTAATNATYSIRYTSTAIAICATE